MEKKQLFSIFNKPKKSLQIPLTSKKTSNAIINVEDDEIEDDPIPILVTANHEPTLNVPSGINVILDLGDIDSGPGTPILEVSFIKYVQFA